MNQQTENKITSDRIRVICDINKYPVYKKAPYIIPIIESGGTFRTGQDLSPKQMMRVKTAKGQILEPDPLTEEQKKKYPFVIDPTNQYKIRHLTWLDKKDPFQSALLKLMLISGYWAENKIVFDKNPVKYHGYFEDPISEVIVRNNIKQEKFEAESVLRQSSMDDYKRIALIFSFNVPEAHITLKASKDEIFGQLLDLCESHPKEMKMCFHKYNEGIDRDIFILECIDAKIIQRKDGNDLWYQNEYIGKNIEDVKRFLGTRDKEHLYAKFQALIDQANGKTITDFQMANTNDPVKKTEMEYIMECKAAIFDGDVDLAGKLLLKIGKDNYPVEYESLKDKISEMKKSKEANKENVLVDKFKAELVDLPIDQIQVKISHPKSNYKEEDCKNFWDKKDELIEYMVKVKFKKQ